MYFKHHESCCLIGLPHTELFQVKTASKRLCLFTCLFFTKKDLVKKAEEKGLARFHFLITQEKACRNSLLSSSSLAPITCSRHDDCSYFVKISPELIERVSALDDLLICFFIWLISQGFVERSIHVFPVPCFPQLGTR